MQKRDPMFVLGQVARCIWRDGPVPPTTLALLLTRPLAGLEAAMAKPEAKLLDQSELIRLLKRLRGIPPVVPVTLGHQKTFWLGWHEYSPGGIETSGVAGTQRPLRSAA